MFNFTSKIGTLEGPNPGQTAGLLDILLLIKIKQFAIEQNLIRDRMTLTHRFSLIFKLLQIIAKNPARGVFFSVYVWSLHAGVQKDLLVVIVFREEEIKIYNLGSLTVSVS